MVANQRGYGTLATPSNLATERETDLRFWLNDLVASANRSNPLDGGGDAALLDS
jgi:hypothetical protein